MDKFFKHLETYPDIYVYVAKSPRTSEQLKNYLIGQVGIQTRTATDQVKKAENGSLSFLNLSDEKIHLDQDGMIAAFVSAGEELGFDVFMEPKKKKKSEDSIASVVDPHSRDFNEMKAKYNAANKTIKKLEKQVEDLKAEQAITAANSIVACMNSKVLVPATVVSEPAENLSEDYFLTSPQMQLDSLHLTSKEGGILHSIFDVDKSRENELTNRNYIQRIFSQLRSSKIFKKRKTDEEQISYGLKGKYDLDSNRSKSIQLLLDDKSLTNQTKLMTYAFWYFHDDPEMEELLTLAGRYGINADYVIRLLEKPVEYRNYKTMRAFLLQALSSSEVRIKKEAAQELLCGDWYVVADYCGKLCHFKLMPVEELQEFKELIEKYNFDKALDVIQKVLDHKSTCGPADHKLETENSAEEIREPNFLHEGQEDINVHASIDESAIMDHFKESEEVEDE